MHAWVYRYILFIVSVFISVSYLMQLLPSSANDSPFWTTNSGAPVWNNNSSMTVGTRGTSIQVYIFHLLTFKYEYLVYDSDDMFDNSSLGVCLITAICALTTCLVTIELI